MILVFAVGITLVFAIGVWAILAGSENATTFGSIGAFDTKSATAILEQQEERSRALTVPDCRAGKLRGAR
jgi:hypothetical protein